MNVEDLKILAEAIIGFCQASETSAIKLRLEIQKMLGIAELKHEARVLEDRFKVLKWQDEKGSRLGDYQVAYRAHNLPEAWSHAFNTLRANNSLIANPFKEEGYEFRYWIYPQKYSDRIFRKKLDEARR